MTNLNSNSFPVLLAIHKNRNRSILGVGPSIYSNTVGNLTLQIWFLYQQPNRISGGIEGTTFKLTNIHTTYNDHSCPFIDTGGITPLFRCCLKSRYIDQQGRSGKSVRGFPGLLPGSGWQLPKMDIKIRFIVQDHSFHICSRESFVPYSLYNQTGRTLLFAVVTKKDLTTSLPTHWTEIPNGETKTFSCRSLKTKKRHQVSKLWVHCFVQCLFHYYSTMVNTGSINVLVCKI